jgi:N-carbamoylputrescine amidase
MHIPDDPLYYEKFYFTPGDLGFKSASTSAGKIGTLVCWDQWYPEGARLTSLKGAEILFFPTAIGWHPSEKDEFGTAQYEAWQTAQRAHAIANGVFVCAVNRTGHEHGDVKFKTIAADGNPATVELHGPGDHSANSGLEFWGGSFIADPFGRIIAQASHNKEEVLIADLDHKLIEVTRQHWPFLRDRRVDAYEGIAKRFLD